MNNRIRRFGIEALALAGGFLASSCLLSFLTLLGFRVFGESVSWRWRGEVAVMLAFVLGPLTIILTSFLRDHIWPLLARTSPKRLMLILCFCGVSGALACRVLSATTRPYVEFLIAINHHQPVTGVASIEGLYFWGVVRACMRAQPAENTPPIWLRVLVFLWGIAWPVLLLIAATFVFIPDYQTKGNHWIHYANDGWAGATIWPLYILASFVLTDGLLIRTYAAVRRFPAFLAAVVLVFISGWYTYATAFLDATEAGYLGGRLLAIFPGLACVHYVLLAFWAWRMSELPRNLASQVAAWSCALAISFGLKYPFAKSMLAQLPMHVPPDYGDCFVVTAAARGHPRIVGSWVNAEGRRVNGQLQRLKRFEYLLMDAVPRIHSALRAVYNRIGPWMARRIRLQMQADAVYVLLKPLEWLAWVALVLSRSREKRNRLKGPED